MKIPDKNRAKPDTLVSVCCVLLGFDENELHILLEKRSGLSGKNPSYTLPGEWLENGDDPASVAGALLEGLPGRRRVRLTPFRTYIFPVFPCGHEESLPQPVARRIVVITYVSLYKIAGKVFRGEKKRSFAWHPAGNMPSETTMEERRIVDEAKKAVLLRVEADPAVVFEYLPLKFTASQLRRFYEILYGRSIDIRNFHKRMSEQPYIVPLEEWEESVSHRAARYYRFNKIKYNRQRMELYGNE